ncbi:hypothetical protein DRP77_11605 [Candidatus Poribacteria bacterium]|nr:MAG: hypothetical protein DRP77_11605 [Candidatus Poribacteria bacterium]
MRTLFIIAILSLLAAASHAHKVNVFAWVEGDQVQVEGYFSDGTPCKGAKVEVYDLQSGSKLLEGSTDEEGIFSFERPEANGLRIVLIGSMGHRAETRIGPEELGGEKSAGETAPSETARTAPSASELESIVKKAVQEGIRPLIRMMEEERSRVRLADLIGGLGYIAGVWGTVMFLLARRRQKSGDRNVRP